MNLNARHVHGDEVNGVVVRRSMMDRIGNQDSLFKASTGWLRRLMKRFNVVFKTPNASIDEESVDRLQMKQGKMDTFKKWYIDLLKPFENYFYVRSNRKGG